VGLIEYYWNSPLNLQKSSLGSKIYKSLDFNSAQYLYVSEPDKNADTFIRNTFPLPEIIYDEFLIFSLHVFLLGVLFCNQVFAAYNLTSPEELSRLHIPPSRNELLLRLNQRLDNIPVFRKTVKTPNG
jgi:hypothetical protein